MVKKHLGEIVIRTTNFDRMAKFYHDVIGLEEFLSFRSARFFKIAEDFEGHPQVLAIFKPEIPSNGPGEPLLTGVDHSKSPLHHFAFSVEKQDFLTEKNRLESLGCELRTDQHFPMKWHSFYLYDPDGNTVEFVCYDKMLAQERAN